LHALFPTILARYDPDAVADQEHATELLKGKVGPTGRPAGAKGNKLPLPKGGTDREAARLATRRPDLAEAVRSGTMKLSARLYYGPYG
jgi:hypothetical protein